MNRNGGGEFPGGGNYARKQDLFYRKMPENSTPEKSEKKEKNLLTTPDPYAILIFVDSAKR